MLPVIPESRDETIEVRADERFDEPALAEYLRGKLTGAEGDPIVSQFAGGAANLTYQLDYGDHVYVLRRPPLGPVAPRAHDMGREYQVLSRIHSAYPPAPRAYVFCDDPSVIGAEFLVMERRYGTVVRRTMPESFAQLPGAPRELGEALVDGLADLHTVDYQSVGLGDLGRPEGFIERQVAGWHQRWEAAKADELPAMESAYSWLAAHLPVSRDYSLVHNDFKLDNCMFTSHDPSHLEAVFDWDMATLGDPLSDLGGLLAYWVEPSDPEGVKSFSPMPSGVDGFPSRSELVERYARRSGRDVAEIDFYHALGLYRVAVILAQLFIRWQRGQTRDERFAGMWDITKLVAEAAAAKASPG